MTEIEEHALTALKAIQLWSWSLPLLLREADVWKGVDAAIAEIEAANAAPLPIVIIINVLDGFAEIAQRPDSVRVLIRDYDAPKDADGENVLTDDDDKKYIVHADEGPGALLVPAKQAHYRNFYKCYRCKHKWEDVWDAMPDDDCPSCGARHVSPYKSEDA